jgi:Ca2+-binding EF-hand superfamily protein
VFQRTVFAAIFVSALTMGLETSWTLPAQTLATNGSNTAAHAVYNTTTGAGTAGGTANATFAELTSIEPTAPIIRTLGSMPAQLVPEQALASIELAVTLVFTSEVLVKVIAEGYKPYRYLSSWWNWLDLTTVAGCWISGGVPFESQDEVSEEGQREGREEEGEGEEGLEGQGAAQQERRQEMQQERRLSAASAASSYAKAGTAGTGGFASALFAPLRLLRLLRLLKLLRSVPQLQLIVVAFLEGLASVRYIGILLCLAIYIYAIFGVMAFELNDPWHFGSLHAAVLTMFRCATLDAWADVMYINMLGCAHYGYGPMPHLCTHSSGSPLLAAAFFVSFTLVSALVLLSLFLGVVTTSMDEQSEREAIRKKESEEAAAIAATHDVPRPLLRLMHTAFELLDYDKSGSIDADELEVALESLGVGGPTGGVGGNSVVGASNASNGAKEVVAEVLRLMGSDDSGQITRPSFIRFVLQTSQRQHQQRQEQQRQEEEEEVLQQREQQRADQTQTRAKKVQWGEHQRENHNSKIGNSKSANGEVAVASKGSKSPRQPLGMLWHTNDGSGSSPTEHSLNGLPPTDLCTPPLDANGAPLKTPPIPTPPLSALNPPPYRTIRKPVGNIAASSSGAIITSTASTTSTANTTSGGEGKYGAICKRLYHKQQSSHGSLDDWCQTPPRAGTSPATGPNGTPAVAASQAPPYATVRKTLRRAGPGQLQGSLRDVGVQPSQSSSSSPSFSSSSPPFASDCSDGASCASGSPDSLLSSPGCSSPSPLHLSHRVDFEV